MTVSRRGLLLGGTSIAAASALGLIAPSSAQAQIVIDWPGDHEPVFGTPIAGSQWLGTAPNAAHPSIVAKNGHAIKTLHPHRGKVFYGYGNYDTNAGSGSGLGIDVSSYDPSSASFVVDLAGYNTEEIAVYRTLADGSLATPAIDPFAGYALLATDRSGAWARSGVAGASPEHVYDVGSTSTGVLLACGSSMESRATIWKSVDGGASWSVLYQEPAETTSLVDGYERFYWMAVLGSTVWVKADNGVAWKTRPPMRGIDVATGRVLGSLSGRKIATGGQMGYSGTQTWSTELGDTARSGADVAVSGKEILFIQSGALYALDPARGSFRRAGSASQFGRTDAGELLTSGGDGVVLHRGATRHVLSTGVWGPVAVIGSTLFHASGADLYSRTVTVPASSTAPDATPSQPPKGKGKK